MKYIKSEVLCQNNDKGIDDDKNRKIVSKLAKFFNEMVSQRNIITNPQQIIVCFAISPLNYPDPEL